MARGIQRQWIGRVLIGVVLFFNMQCAILFLFAPKNYASSFELSGAAGEGMIAGMGILFLMWNVPYAFAFAAPIRMRYSLYEAILMQAIGFCGEFILQSTFPAGHPVIHATVTRFIAFDGAGLVMLLLAAGITHKVSIKAVPARPDRSGM